MNKHVLLCGNDGTLLLTREKVLRAHFPVAVMVGVAGLREKLEADCISLVVLCHSLSLAERNVASGLIRQKDETLKILTLRKTAEGVEDDSVGQLEGLAGPEKLIERVRAMLCPQAMLIK